LENQCLATLPTVESTLSLSPLLHCLPVSHMVQADLCSHIPRNCLLAEPPSRRVQHLSEESELPTWPKALKSTAATERVQEATLVISPILVLTPAMCIVCSCH
jgi:hypothetical protein